MALDAKTPLSSDQKTQIAKIASDLYDATSKMQDDLTNIIAVLNNTQRNDFFKPHKQPGNPPTPPSGSSPGSDPRIARAIQVLTGKAGSTAMPIPSPSAGAPFGPPTLHRSLVADGIVALESSSTDALTPAQARTALDALQDVQTQVGRLVNDETALNKVLTSDQSKTMTGLMQSPLSETMTARCLLLWAQKH